MYNRLKLAFISASALFLCGCGASNVVGSALGLADILEDDSAGSIGNVAGQSVGVLQEDQGASQPVGAGLPVALNALFGAGFFSFGFSASDTVFVLETAFNNGSVNVSDEGLYSLITVGRLTSSDDEGATIEDNGNREIFCTHFDSESQYLCLIGLAEGSTANFLFSSPLVDNISRGNFEFCDTTVTTEACIGGLFNEPDGFVRLRMDYGVAATDGMTVEAAVYPPFVTHAEDRMKYLEQGTVGFNANNGVVTQRSASQDVFEAARDALLSQK